MDELLFRIIFSALWFVFIANLTWVRYRAREPKPKSTNKQPAQSQTRLHSIALALFAPFWFGGIILYIIIPNWIMFLSIPLPNWFRLIMAGLATVSIPFTIWAYRTIGRNWVHALEPSNFKQKKTDELVTKGPYHYVRNPIYLGSFTFIIALALLAANLLLLLPSLVIITIIYTQIRKEEIMLLERFGEQYREYMNRTPRLIPKLKRH
jgi:protein-S-isoprenylcysteine O-methyltransferase Ste14